MAFRLESREWTTCRRTIPEFTQKSKRNEILETSADGRRLAYEDDVMDEWGRRRGELEGGREATTAIAPHKS